VLDVAAWENASVTRVEVAVGGGGPAVRAAAELAVVQTAACNAGLDQTEFLVVQARLVNGGDQEALRRGGGNQVVVVLPGEEDERGGARVRWQEARARQPLGVDWAREAATHLALEVDDGLPQSAGGRSGSSTSVLGEDPSLSHQAAGGA